MTKNNFYREDGKVPSYRMTHILISQTFTLTSNRHGYCKRLIWKVCYIDKLETGMLLAAEYTLPESFDATSIRKRIVENRGQILTRHAKPKFCLTILIILGYLELFWLWSCLPFYQKRTILITKACELDSGHYNRHWSKGHSTPWTNSS